MSSASKKQTQGSNRRNFLIGGAAATTVAGVGINKAFSQTAVPTNQAPSQTPETLAQAPKPPAALGTQLRTNSKTGIRTAIITDTQLNIGPYLAEEFARRNYNLVIADVKKGLPDQLRPARCGRCGRRSRTATGRAKQRGAARSDPESRRGSHGQIRRLRLGVYPYCLAWRKEYP